MPSNRNDQPGNRNSRNRRPTQGRRRATTRPAPEQPRTRKTARTASTRTQKAKKPRKRRGIVIPFRTNMPAIRERANVRFIFMRDKLRFLIPWRRLIVTFLLIFLGGMGSVLTQAQVAVLQNDIDYYERQLQGYLQENFVLDENLRDRYRVYEIERIAIERLGMAHPDPSQIIMINVPRQGTVELNTAEHVLPRENYFRQDLTTFLRGLVDRIFRG